MPVLVLLEALSRRGSGASLPDALAMATVRHFFLVCLLADSFHMCSRLLQGVVVVVVGCRGRRTSFRFPLLHACLPKQQNALKRSIDTHAADQSKTKENPPGCSGTLSGPRLSLLMKAPRAISRLRRTDGQTMWVATCNFRFLSPCLPPRPLRNDVLHRPPPRRMRQRQSISPASSISLAVSFLVQSGPGN
ncbi:hypothetical protein HDK64DRAFT_142558 [Phyllosticta capitalensis]